MVAPDAGDLVEHRLGGVGVCPDVLEREIGSHIGAGERRKRQQGKDKHPGRNGRTDGHQLLIAQPCTGKRHDRLYQRKRKRQHQGEVAQFVDH